MYLLSYAFLLSIRICIALRFGFAGTCVSYCKMDIFSSGLLFSTLICIALRFCYAGTCVRDLSVDTSFWIGQGLGETPC